MKYLGNARAVLVSLMVLAVALRVLLWAITPLVPYLVVGLVLVLILGVAWFRTTKW